MSYEANKAWRKKNPGKRTAQRSRYYKQSQNPLRGRRKWPITDSDFILTSEGPDSVMSTLLDRSVEAIQHKRCRLRKEV